MNILFLTLSNVSNIEESGIYQDLLREFAKKGDNVFVVSPVERRNQEKTGLIKNGNATFLRVKIGNIQKTNFIEKGISTVLLERQYISAIKKYLPNVKFDLVLYSTPPITLVGAVKYIKKRDGAKTYLLLKDIFPQNAVDLGLLSKSGIKGFIYKYFRRKEKILYAVSDKIGCMSQANVNYFVKHNPEVPKDIVELCPNCVEPIDMSVSSEEKCELRKKYGLPLDKKIFVYGGNLGRPQDVPFLIKCLKSCADKDDFYFVVAGNGTDMHYLEEYVEKEKPSHVKLFGFIPKAEYDKMVACCDIGLVFLDHRFTIPNFPSRALSYMQAKLPIMCVTDKNSDIGQIAIDNGFGWWCESCDTEAFKNTAKMASTSNIEDMGNRAWKFMEDNYSAEFGYSVIVKSIGG